MGFGRMGARGGFGGMGRVGGRSGASALWDPSKDAVFIAWWDAQSLSSSPVASWTDRIGGTVASQATGANQPTWSATARNSKPGLNFLAASSQLLNFTPTGFPSGSAALSVGVAGFAVAGGFFNCAFAYGANTGSGTIRFRLDGSGTTNTQISLGPSSLTGTAWAGTDQMSVVTIPAGATPTGSLYQDGNAATTLVMGTSALTTDIASIGAISSGGNYWNGTIQQVIAANAVLTTSQRQKLEGWESWYDGKAGANLPGGHPYKSRAPFVSDP